MHPVKPLDKGLNVIEMCPRLNFCLPLHWPFWLSILNHTVLQDLMDTSTDGLSLACAALDYQQRSQREDWRLSSCQCLSCLSNFQWFPSWWQLKIRSTLRSQAFEEQLGRGGSLFDGDISKLMLGSVMPVMHKLGGSRCFAQKLPAFWWKETHQDDLLNLFLWI